MASAWFLKKDLISSLRVLLTERKEGVTVLANKRDFNIKTFQSMVRQSGLKEHEFLKHKK